MYICTCDLHNHTVSDFDGEHFLSTPRNSSNSQDNLCFSCSGSICVCLSVSETPGYQFGCSKSKLILWIIHGFNFFLSLYTIYRHTDCRCIISLNMSIPLCFYLCNSLTPLVLSFVKQPLILLWNKVLQAQEEAYRACSLQSISKRKSGTCKTTLWDANSNFSVSVMV